MSSPAINYIIATYDGKRGGCNHPRDKYDNETEMVLQKHFKVLLNSLKSDTFIKQITLIRNHDRNSYYKRYYEIDEYVEKIKEKLGISVVIIEQDMLFKSPYSQYLYIFQMYPNFDFNILMEDDWVPAPNLDSFDRILVNEYEKCNNTGFLSSWVTDRILPIRHSTISVGIVSKKSMTTVYEKIKNLNYKKSINISQIEFSELFDELHDYSDNGKNYMIPFWETNCGKIFEYAENLSKKYLLVPIQFLNLNKYNYVVAPSDRFGTISVHQDIFEWVKKCNEKDIPKNRIRNLVKCDYEQYCKLINTNITRKMFDNFIDNILGCNHAIIVQEYEGKLVAVGTLLVEEKMTYGGCKMGHIENIFVDPNYRRMGFGEKIVNKLLTSAEKKKCYRVDLNCNSELEGFYKKMNLKQKHICMNIYFKENFN